MTWKLSSITFLSLLTILICGLLDKYTVGAIKCYQCSSSKDVHCTEQMDVRNTNLKAINCSYVYGEAYCIKTTGMYNGEVGTTRFCSSENLGQICDFQQRMGDVRSYRSCVYTCTTDGCNSGTGITPNLITLAFTVIVLVIFHRF